MGWAQKAYPEAAPLDHYGFAAVVWSQFGWSDPWSVLDQRRAKDEQALLMLHHARGDVGSPDDFAQSARLDEQGHLIPPVADLDTWTRWMWSRLVAHYFARLTL